MTAPDGALDPGTGISPEAAAVPSSPRTARAPAEWGERLAAGYCRVRAELLAERIAGGHWVGELSTSALSTATAVMALEMVRRGLPACRPNERRDAADSDTTPRSISAAPGELSRLTERGVQWLAAHQNSDGGWGDTTRSVSNISTTMLCHAVFVAAGAQDRFAAVVAAAKVYIERAGGVDRKSTR